MASLDGTFDATTVDPSQSFPVYPAGKYICQIDQSEMRPTKAGTGQYLWLELSILDGEHAGGKLFDILNLVNPNPQAQEIAQRTLSAICHATGVMQVTDSEQLHFKPMRVDVRVKPAVRDAAGNEQYAAKNEVKGYSAPTSGTAAPPATRPAGAVSRPAGATAPAATKPAATGAANPPWRR